MSRLCVLSLLLLLLAACAPAEPAPDPLGRHWADLQEDALPAGFDVDALPRYDITLRVDADARQVDGTSRLRFRNHSGRPLNDFYVRLYPNLPQLGGSMRLNGVRTLPGRFAAGWAFAANNSAARITLTEPLLPDQFLELEIDFTVQAPERSGYVLFGYSEGILALPYSYPILAAQTGDPTQPWRLDVPPTHGDIAFADPALYTVTATVPSDHLLVATGVEISRTATTPGWSEQVIVTGPAREWCMVVSKELQVESLEVDGVKLNSYYLPMDQAAGRAALNQAAAVLRTYNRLFVPYPYRELDIVQAPLRYLGMEFPGLNFIGMDTYRRQRESQEVLVAHEIAHQWWYGLVGSDPFRYPWLDEGLAEHSSMLYMETIYGQQAADRMRTLRWQIPTQWAITHGYDDVVGQEVTSFRSTNYEILVYAKSALFFDALYEELGRQRYLEVLRAFIERYRLATPTPQDFLEVVAEVGGIDPRPLYAAWILSATPAAGIETAP